MRCTSASGRSTRGPGSACRRTCGAPRPTSSDCARSTRRSGSSKGAYDEPEKIAWRDRSAVDASFAALAVEFLTGSKGRPIRLGLGTHDVTLIELIAEQVAAAGIGRDAFEVEMLYGIRSGEQYRLAKAGYRVQTLIAYGDAWYPWYMRRLAERPANVAFAIRSMLP